MRIKKLVALGLSLVVLVSVVFNLELSSPRLPDVYAAPSGGGYGRFINSI